MRDTVSTDPASDGGLVTRRDEDVEETESPVGDDAAEDEEDAPSRSDSGSEADDESRTSSTISEVVVDVPLDSLIKIGPADCRVRMSKRVGSRNLPAICGRVCWECTRASHALKRDSTNPTVRGPAGFYVEYVNERGERSGDGRDDVRHYSSEEFAFLRARAVSERAEVEAALGRDEDPPPPDRARYTSEDSAPSRAPDRSRYSTPREKVAGVSFDLPQRFPVPPPRATTPTPRAHNRSAVPPDEDTIEGPLPPTAPAEVWYCVEERGGHRIATTSSTKLFDLQNAGHALRQVVRTKHEARAWCNDTGPGSSFLSGTPPVFPAPNPPPSPIDLTGNGGGAAKNPTSTLLSRISTMATGRDPSEGTQLIYDMSPANKTATDEFLLPPGLSDPDSRTEFYEMAMDVASLPGGYKQTDTDDFTNNEALFAALSKGKSTQFRAWRRPNFNRLCRITSKEEVLRFVTDVEKTVPRTRLAQQNKMRKFLFSCNHGSDLTEVYVVSGPLPALIEHTYLHFMALLNTLCTVAFEHESATWKGSYLERMVTHHSNELGQIRQTASDYRMHLLETYIYLRNARKDKFQDASFMRTFFDQMSRPGAKPGREDEEQPGAAPTRCAHCRRNGIHPGLTKEDCPLKALTRTKAQAALQGMNRSQAKKAASAIASSISANPSGNHDAVVAKVREEVL